MKRDKPRAKKGGTDGLWNEIYKKLFLTEFQIILSGSSVCLNGLQSSVTVFRRRECMELQTVFRINYTPSAVRIAMWLEEIDIMTNYFAVNNMNVFAASCYVPDIMFSPNSDFLDNVNTIS